MENANFANMNSVQSYLLGIILLDSILNKLLLLGLVMKFLRATLKSALEVQFMKIGFDSDESQRWFDYQPGFLYIVLSKLTLGSLTLGNLG